MVKLRDIKAENTIVFFYPKDDTPGCTIEAKGFSEDLAKFKRLGAEVIGISGGDEQSKAQFCEKHHLATVMLADPDFSVAAAYGAYGEKNRMGKKSQGIFRKTFVLDRAKKVLKVYDEVTPEGHSAEILEFLKPRRSAAG